MRERYCVSERDCLSDRERERDCVSERENKPELPEPISKFGRHIEQMS